jgi:hypothetical protein
MENGQQHLTFDCFKDEKEAAIQFYKWTRENPQQGGTISVVCRNKGEIKLELIPNSKQLSEILKALVKSLVSS